MADQWYVKKGGKKHGPFSTDQLKKLATSGKIDRADLLWKEGMEKWVACGSAKGLFAAEPAAARPAAPPPPPPANPLDDFDAGHPAAAFADFEVPAYVPTPEAPPPLAAAPPALPSVSVKPARRLDFAGFGSRASALILDSLVLFIPTLGIMAGFMPPPSQWQDEEKLMASMMGAQIVGTLFNIAYGTVMESSAAGGTVGKRAMGIRVADLQGRRVGPGRALLRNFVKPFSSFLAIGFILAAVTPRKQSLHDLVAGTVVVKA